MFSVLFLYEHKHIVQICISVPLSFIQVYFSDELLKFINFGASHMCIVACHSAAHWIRLKLPERSVLIELLRLLNGSFISYFTSLWQKKINNIHFFQIQERPAISEIVLTLIWVWGEGDNFTLPFGFPLITQKR